MSFIGGKLKLKGSSDLPGVKKKKKSKANKANERALAAKEEDVKKEGGEKARDKDAELMRELHGYELEQRDEEHDRRTEAEKKKEARMAKLEEERLRRFAEKSHRERINEFNTHLSTLSEHHDIPKVA
eukprot:352421-Chlamydomonas_euryale.AAC.59